MASKKYIDKTCVYCAARRSTTADHVLAREFFPVAQRHNLPKVPACTGCNNAKAALEHYLTTLLPLGGRQPGAGAQLEDMVAPRLARNSSLRRSLDAGRERVWTREATGIAPTSALPFDSEKFDEYLALVTRGLMWHHWSELVLQSTEVEAHLVTPLTEADVEQSLAKGSGRSICQSWGASLFAYCAKQDNANRQVSVWMFRVFGGLKILDGNTECSCWVAMTRPNA